MPIRVELINADQLAKIGQMSKQVRENLMQDLTKAATFFGFRAVDIAKTKYLTGPRPGKLDTITGHLRASITPETKREGDVISTSIGSNKVYARIHELGGRIEATPMMYNFFWAKFISTKDLKWKWMALGLRNKGFVTIPARPYLSTAIADALPAFRNNLATVLSKLNFTGEHSEPEFQA